MTDRPALDLLWQHWIIAHPEIPAPSPGFFVCAQCGRTFPGDDSSVFKVSDTPPPPESGLRHVMDAVCPSCAGSLK